MATTNRKKSRPGRSLLGLALVVVAIFGVIAAGVKWSDADWTPKLALDLEGGTQIILRPDTANNEKITSEDINQAIAIIRQRVNSTGVAEAEITSQGGNNIVVSLPGKPSEDILDLVRETAQMQFRPVLYFGSAQPVVSNDLTGQGPIAPTDVPTETPSATPTEGATEPADGATTPADGATTEPADGATTEPADGATTEPADGATTPAVTNPSDFAQVTPELLAELEALKCSADGTGSGGGAPKDPTKPIVVCSADGTTKYILGPMELAGTDIASATSGLQVSSTGATLSNWVVNIKFTGEGAKKFTEVTTRLSKLPEYSTWILTADNPTSAPNMFAMVLDNQVISAPGVTTVIADGKAEISGDFNRETATTLANQLNFGALPLTFEVQSESQISATLGSEQLEKGILAGLIGLLLVVIYSLFQYRALGLVTVASLLIAGVLTYGLITLLSWTQGYRLSLPGVAGLIVAIGITADSFIVYFERIRDELRDGRTLTSAVDTGWDRARRTILASDTVNLLAAVVLYFLAVGGVRGFAFTLGLTTVIDVIVVFFFTHPLMKLLSKTKFFADGHPASGLDPHRLGATSVRYAGRGRVSRVDGEATQADLSLDKGAAAARQKQLVGAAAVAGGQPTMTIAQRRAAEAAKAAEAASAVDDDTETASDAAVTVEPATAEPVTAESTTPESPSGPDTEDDPGLASEGDERKDGNL